MITKVKSFDRCLVSQHLNIFVGCLQHSTAKVVDYESADGLMKHGLEVQQESKESLQRSVAKVAETLQVTIFIPFIAVIFKFRDDSRPNRLLERFCRSAQRLPRSCSDKPTK